MAAKKPRFVKTNRGFFIKNFQSEINTNSTAQMLYLGAGKMLQSRALSGLTLTIKLLVAPTNISTRARVEY